MKIFCEVGSHRYGNFRWRGQLIQGPRVIISSFLLIRRVLISCLRIFHSQGFGFGVVGQESLLGRGDGLFQH